MERLTFWLYPSAYTAPARLAALEPGLGSALAERLLATPRLAARLSRRILRRAGLGPDPLPAESPAFAFARLPAADLVRVARACGALLHHTAIRAVVMREDRQRLRALLGADTHEMALKRAPFLRLPTRPTPAGGLEAAVERDGLACLRARFAGEAPGLAGRLALKFAPDAGLDAPDAPELAGEAGRRVLARVLREGDPAWRAFSS